MNNRSERSAPSRAFSWRQTLDKAVQTSLTLFKIIIPVSIATKILGEMGAIDFLGGALAPVMKVVGLPGSMGLAWATAMVTNLYGGMAVFWSLLVKEPITAAQATVVTTMFLIAHALPLELQIARKAGARFWPMAILRVGGAFACGWMLYRLYAWGGWHAERATLLWNPAGGDASWRGWALSELKNLGMIFLIIWALLLLLALLERLGVTKALIRLLGPVLRRLGISAAAAPLTIIGMTLGISYGGGLIIQESRSGRIDGRAVFYSLALLGLCHSLIEDTLLMRLLGGAFSGVLWGRLLFALVSVALLMRLLSPLSEETFRRYLFPGAARDLS
ncbi:MAG: nucleoside recognition domain-containing protein [Planctomycetota bacterium]